MTGNTGNTGKIQEIPATPATPEIAATSEALAGLFPTASTCRSSQGLTRQERTSLAACD